MTQAQFDYIQRENELLHGKVAYLMRQLYGRKREISTNGQTDFFEKSEAFTAPEPSAPEPEDPADKPTKRKKRKGKEKAQLARLHEAPMHHEQSDAEWLCPDCVAEMLEIGATVTSREPVRIPEYVELYVHYQHAL